MKDASTADHERHVSAFLVSGACTSKSACGRRSLPQRPLDIRCRRCVAERGGDPFPTADRTKAYVPTPSREGRRHPVDRDAFHRCESAPSVRAGISPHPNPARRSLAHAAHTLSPGWGECHYGPCKHQSAVTRDPWHSRNRPPFLPMGSILSDLSCLGLTTQARPSARTAGADGED